MALIDFRKNDKVRVSYFPKDVYVLSKITLSMILDNKIFDLGENKLR